MNQELLNQDKSIRAMCKFLLWLLCGLVISFIGLSNVFAADLYTNITELRSTTQVLVSTDDVPGNPVSVSPNSDVTFNHVTQITYILQGYNFLANKNYQLESHLSRQQLTYANQYTVQGANGEQCLISYDYSIFQDAYPRWAFQCPSATNTITITIKNSSNGYLWSNTPTSPNWNIFSWTTALLKGADFSLGGSGDDTDNIINNQNQNTQNIINNQNQNTQNIINSIDNTFNTCRDSVNLFNGNFSQGIISPDNGSILTSPYSSVSTDLIKVKPNTYYTYSDKEGHLLNRYASFDSSGNFIERSGNLNVHTIHTGSNVYYIRFNIYDVNGITPSDIHESQLQEGSTSTDYEEYNKQICTNKLDEQEKTSKGILGKLGDLFNTLFSDDDADVSGLNNMVGWLPPGPVDSIINLPLALFNALMNTITGTCQSVTLTLPFVNTTLVLPCFDAYMSQYVTGFSTLWTLVGTILSVFMLYRYLLTLYKWVDDTLTLRENNLPGYYDDNWGGGA